MLRKLKLAQNNLTSLNDLKSIGLLLGKITELEIEDNQILRLSILRSNIAFMWPNIMKVNGHDLTTQDRITGKRLFGRLAKSSAATSRDKDATTALGRLTQEGRTGKSSSEKVTAGGTKDSAATKPSSSRTPRPGTSSSDLSTPPPSRPSSTSTFPLPLERQPTEDDLILQAEVKSIAEEEIRKAVQGVEDSRKAAEEFERLWDICINQFIKVGRRPYISWLASLSFLISQYMLYVSITPQDTLNKIENERAYMATCLEDDLE